MSAETQAVYLPLDELEEAPSSPRERLRRGGSWLAAFLALVMLVTVAWSVQAAAWSDGLGLVQTAVVAGALVGLLLALTNWGSLFTTLYSLLASVAWIANLLVHSYLGELDLHTGLLEIATRFNTWGYHLLHRQSSADNLIFVAQLLILGWWMGHFAMWMIVRHQQPWLAALPAGIGLMFNAYYSPKNLTGYLLLFLATVLLLAIRVELARNEMRWQLAHIRYAPDIYLDFLRDGVIFAVIVVALTWALPAGTGEQPFSNLFKPFETQWKDLTNTWNQAFTNLRYPARTGVSTFGKSLTLGGPVSLTDRPIFEAQSPERVYWRAAAFDTYDGQRWLNTDQRTTTLNPGVTLPEPNYLLTREITVTVRTIALGQDVLFGAPQPLRTSLPVDIDYSPLSPGDTAPVGFQQGLTVSLIRSRTAMGKDSVYQMTSRISAASPDMLRAEGTDYPEGVRARYLQVPASLPARVRNLAAQLTAPYDNAYDKASAVEAYVRSFPYDNQIPAPPQGRDGVDYFLFDIKRGYCDYYASAMAMMLRSVGVPARFVVGYTPGEFISDTNSWLIQEQNAHAWVEVFFPEYGWIQFEPTAAQPALARPTAAPTSVATPAPTEAVDPFDPREHSQQGDGTSSNVGATNPPGPFALWLAASWPVLAVIVLVLGLVSAGIVFFRRRQRQLLAPDRGLISRLFDLLPFWAARLHIPWPASHTPLEHARSLGSAVPEVAPPADNLARLYVAQRYGRQEPDREELQAAAGDWRRIQPMLWKSWLRSLMPAPRQITLPWRRPPRRSRWDRYR